MVGSKTPQLASPAQPSPAHETQSKRLRFRNWSYCAAGPHSLPRHAAQTVPEAHGKRLRFRNLSYSVVGSNAPHPQSSLGCPGSSYTKKTLTCVEFWPPQGTAVDVQNICTWTGYGVDTQNTPEHTWCGHTKHLTWTDMVWTHKTFTPEQTWCRHT